MTYFLGRSHPALCFRESWGGLKKKDFYFFFLAFITFIKKITNVFIYLSKERLERSRYNIRKA